RLNATGAVYTDAPVEVDGRIVTASGPENAKDFGEAIAGLLAE
ncbi:MAG: DJ-1 family protein, partial [Clostridia bacterium]|nr:DJ-1 family protein [Clostridia bacterium]